MQQVTVVMVMAALLIFSSITEAKKRCKPLLKKLQNIQALQRSGYSSTQGISLRAKEDKARNNWWQCEKGRSNKSKKKSKSVSKKAKNTSKSKKPKANYIVAGTPFKTNNAIVLKSKYEGNKKQAWLNFYQQPSQCQRPKNLASFAQCSEDKRAQRGDFEQYYEAL